MKRVLILGGSYFAGRVFVEELLKEKDYKIYVFNRGNIPLKMDGAKELVGDRHDEAAIATAIPPLEWHAVVDFCAETDQDILTILNFLPGRIRHYIYISTTSIYKPINRFPVTEDAPKLSGPQPELGPFADYGYNKWLGERLLQIENSKRGINYTCLRPAIIYGPYNYAPRESYFFDLIYNDKEIIIPDTDLPLFSFVYVVDLAKVIIQCLGNPSVFGDSFNVCSHELISYRRLMEIFEKVAGKKLKIRTSSPSEIEKRQIPLPFPLDSHLVYSGKRLEHLLGFQFTPMEKGMEETYNYYKMVQEAKKKRLQG